jgi:hypothetical protein
MCINCGKLCGLAVDCDSGKVDRSLLEERNSFWDNGGCAHGGELSTGYPQDNARDEGGISTQIKTKTSPSIYGGFPGFHTPTITTTYLFIC